MSIQLKELTMKVDALTTTMDRVVSNLSWGNIGAMKEITAPFHKALNEVERVKFEHITHHKPELTRRRIDLKDTITLKEIEEFLQAKARDILHAQDAAGLVIRPNENVISRYVIFLGKYDPTQKAGTSWMQNPRMQLEFNFNYTYSRHDEGWQLFEKIRLVASGGEMGGDTVNVEVIPDRLIRRDVWVALLTHALRQIDAHEVIHELETFFPLKAPTQPT